MVHMCNAEFNVAVLILQVAKCPEDYRCWLTTMYSQFGGKWCCLFNGPCWSVATFEQGAAKHIGRTTWAIQDVRSLQ